VFSVKIEHNDICYNLGPGIDCSDTWGSILGNRIHFNEQSGIRLWMSDPRVSNNVIFGNEDSGIHCDNCDSYAPEILNCTVFANLADEGGGLYLKDSWPEVVNSIFWGNSASSGQEICLEGGSILTISYCDVKGGKTGVYQGTGSVLYWEDGMISENPGLVEVEAGDFHIPHDSPCRDAGDGSVQGLSDEDQEGDPRVAYGKVDMGADEFFPHLYTGGDAVPGGLVHVKFIGLPETAPVALWFSFGVLESPVSTPWGSWYLTLPAVGPVLLAPLPASGVTELSDYLPPTPLGPYRLPMQGFLGSKLTNLATLDVR